MTQVTVGNGVVDSASGLKLRTNGTTEAVDISTGQVATLAQNPILTSGTVNGLAFLNASKVLTTGSALTFDGTNLGAGGSPTAYAGYGPTIGTKGGNGGIFQSQNSAGTANALFYIDGNIGAAYLNTLTNHPWAFKVNDAEQMRLTSTGLGIGTSSPANKLSVYAGGIVANFGAYGTGAYDDIELQAYSGYCAIGTRGSTPLLFNIARSEKMRLDSAGNLGLGVTPSAWSSLKAIDISSWASFVGFSNQVQVAGNTFWNGSNYLYKNNGVSTRYEQNSLGTHSWYTAASGTAGNAISFTQAMTLDASGNLLVGATSNGLVAARTCIQSTIGEYGTAYQSPSNGGVYYHIVFGQNTTAVGSITSTGGVTVYSTTSDYRLKTVIGPVANAGQRIDALRPVEYTWNSNGSRTRGFLAHEFQTVYANSVTGDKDAVDDKGKPVYQSMQASTSEVIADLVAELQSLRARVAALEPSGFEQFGIPKP